MATRAIIHPPTHSINPTTTTAHFCKTCEVMFESSTSLEVHLSYHKENLLSRWASPDSTISTNNMEANKTNNTQQNSNPPSVSPRDGVAQQQLNNGPSYFHPDHGLRLYLPPQYNNNTGDRTNEPSYRPLSGYPPIEHPLQPYGTNNGVPTTMANNGPQEYPPPQQHQLFSPNGANGGPPPPTRTSGENPSAPPVALKQERQSSETPAEILDLDSHKVHVYQHAQQQQQLQQQGADALRNNFYRPYLPHLLAPPPGNQHNGWPPPGLHPHDQFSPSFPPEHHPYGIPPQPGGNIVYELIREDGHRPGGFPPTDPSLQPPMGYSPQLGPIPPSFRGSFPPPVSAAENVNTNVVNDQRDTPPPKKSPPSGVTAKKSAANANGAAPKTKGWKGGECKRPKTYNCTACNKWFTSSGHLKRHYGTTLHKNSVKQKGENPEEQHQQPSGRKAMGAKKSPGNNKMNTGGETGNSSNESNTHQGPLTGLGGAPSPPRSIIKTDESTSSGKSTPVFNNANNANPPNGNFNSDSSNPPYVTNPYVPYNCVQGGPPLHPQYVLQNHFPSPGQSPPPFSNGFTLDTPPSSLGVYSVPPSTMYNGGHSIITTNCETPLPPFRTVAFSHYDPNAFHLTSLQQNQFPPHTSPSPMTPNGGSSGPIYSLGSSSPPRNNLETPFGPDSRNSSHSLNRNSPEAVRSIASGSMEGSLDEISGAGSPVHSLSDLSSGSESVKGESGSDPGDPVILKCPECSKTFGRSCYLTQHTNSSHSGGKPFKCSTCGKRFPEEPALSDHFAKHGSDKPYKCDLCPKQFNHKTDLRRHLCLHTGEKPFLCNICGKGFIRKDHMTKHSETHRKHGSNKVKQTSFA